MLFRSPTPNRAMVFDGEPEKTIARLGVGDFFGERALMTDEPRNATVIAREETGTYALTKTEFKAAIAEYGSLKEQLLKAYFQRQ